MEAEGAAAEAGEASAEHPPPAQAALIDLGHGDFVGHARRRIGKIRRMAKRQPARSIRSAFVG